MSVDYYERVVLEVFGPSEKISFLLYLYNIWVIHASMYGAKQWLYIHLATVALFL